MWPFGPNKAQLHKEAERHRKVVSSQLALLEAATATADVAHHVTTKLKQHLEDSIRQFQSTIEILTDALIMCDAKGRISTFNPAAEMVFAMSADDAKDTNITSLFLVSNRETCDINGLFDTIESTTDEAKQILQGRRANGEIFPLEATLTKLELHNGKIIVLVLVRDTSEWVAMHRLSEIHETRYRALFDLSADGILIVQDQRVVAANTVAAKLFSCEIDSLMAVDIEAIPNEIKIADGSIHQLLFSSTPIVWNDAHASLMTIKDVSDMRGLESKVRAQRGNGIDMIVCFSPDFRITFVNEPYCLYRGLTRDQLIGTDIRTILSEIERNVVMLNVNNLTPASPSRRVQINTNASDGSIRVQDWIDHASYDASGTLIEYQRTGRDISDILKTIMKDDN